jgi:hypothetical protein
MVALLGDHSEEKVIDTHLASALNASLVIGTPQACASEKARLGLTRHPPAKLAQSDTDTQVAAWLGRGETGLSSETIARYLTGQDLGGLGPAGHLPADASDFDRCCLLLDWAPGLRDRLTELRTLSPAWAGLVEVWGELEALRDAGGQGALLHARLQVIRNLEGSPDVR